MEKVLILSIDYNSNIYSKKLISSIDKLDERERIDLHIVFTGEEELNENSEKFIKHKIDNIGYFPAARKVLDSIDIHAYNFIIICNNDIEIVTKEFLQILQDEKEDSDVIAPSIIDLDNKHQNPHRLNNPTLGVLLKYRVYFLNFHLAKFINCFRKVSKGYSEIKNSVSIFSPHGAFIIFRNSYFSKGGYIDNNFFLYGEEDSIGSICKENKMNVLYQPLIKIRHHASVSTGKGISKFKWLEQKKAHSYIKNRYTDFKILR